MQTYLQVIRNSALTILDGGRQWNGGLFKLIGENSILYNAVANRTLNTRLIIGGIKSTMLSGGTLTAIIFTFLLVLVLLAITIISIYCRCRPPNQKYPLGKKLLSRVRRINQQLPISLSLLLGILCALVLIVALIPLVLAFAANSRLHASLSDLQESRPDTIANQISLIFSHVDTFLKNLVPEAREDVKPVIQRTLEMTAVMKAKSQAAYQNEFREVIGANVLTSASSDLLNRIGLYYYTGKSLKEASERVNSAINDLSLKRIQLHTYEIECQSSLGSEAAHICSNHTNSVSSALSHIELVRNNWTQPRPVDGMILQDAIKDLTVFLGNLVGALDATGNTPDKQQELKEQKLAISREFNQNISGVFDRELNSTEFVLTGLEDKLSELDEKIQLARDSLRNASLRVQSSYGRLALKYESLRFGVTTVVNVVMLVVLVVLATAAAIVFAVPNAAKARSRSLIGCVYTSYAAYAVAFIFVCLLFCVTSYLRTETCRYLYEEKTADSYLVPEVNAVISEFKARAARDPNKTDAIPLKGIDRLIGGLLNGCQANQPIIVALNAIRFIDTDISNSAEQSLKFKQKGRDILRREMSSANLEVLRDKTIEDKMINLRTIFVRYSNYNFSTVGMHLTDQESVLIAAHEQLMSLNALNENIDASLSKGSSTKKLSVSNRLNIQASRDAIQALLNITRYFTPLMPILEAKKAVASVIDSVISSNKHMEIYLSNQSRWTETAVEYYTKHVIEGSTNESKAIADSTAIGFLSVIGKCREVYNFYQTSVGIPCKSLLYPMSILWFCLAWFLWFAVMLSLLVHVSLSCFVDSSGQQTQQLPIDDSLALSKRPIYVSNRTAGDEATTQNLLSSA